MHPETPEAGLTLEELFAGRPVDIKQVLAHLNRTAKDLGLPFGKRERTYNSRLAQELGKWADTQPGGEAIHDILYKAYFVDALNVSDQDVLLNAAEQAGLSRDAALEVITNRTFKDAVDVDWMKSRQYGVTGVPTFVAGGAGAVGCQPYEVLEQLMTHAKAGPSVS